MLLRSPPVRLKSVCRRFVAWVYTGIILGKNTEMMDVPETCRVWPETCSVSAARRREGKELHASGKNKTLVEQLEVRTKRRHFRNLKTSCCPKHVVSTPGALRAPDRKTIHFTPKARHCREACVLATYFPARICEKGKRFKSRKPAEGPTTRIRVTSSEMLENGRVASEPVTNVAHKWPRFWVCGGDRRRRPC